MASPFLMAIKGRSPLGFSSSRIINIGGPLAGAYLYAFYKHKKTENLHIWGVMQTEKTSRQKQTNKQENTKNMIRKNNQQKTQQKTQNEQQKTQP